MQIRIEATDLPSQPGAAVGVQRRGKPEEVLEPVTGTVGRATWTIECTAVRSLGGIDVRGPYIQGPPGGRFVYLSWLQAGADGRLVMYRRDKLRLSDVPPALLDVLADSGMLVARLRLTVRPLHVAWSVV